MCVHACVLISLSLLSVLVPKLPNMETLSLLCGDDQLKAELWEELGKALGMLDKQLEKASATAAGNLEKCKQGILNVSRGIPPPTYIPPQSH